MLFPRGGATFETCTVIIKAATSTQQYETIGYTTIVDSELTASTVTVNSLTTTINNVLCGSLLACARGIETFGKTTTNLIVLLDSSYGTFCKITASADDTAILSVSNDHAGGGV